MTRICTTMAIICIIGMVYSSTIDRLDVKIQDIKNCSTVGAIVFLILALVGWNVKARKQDN